ncbi:MAG: AAA family ATPase [Sideroxydans sp.]|nr:AAA family ATPase [Sideroxydans sp.]
MSSNTNLLVRELAPSIRKGTEHELGDAFNLANVLENASGKMDRVTFEFSIDLFVAVTLSLVHEKDEATLFDVLNQPLNPGWDSEKQMLIHFGGEYTAKQLHKNTERWLIGFEEKVKRLDNIRAQQLVRRCHEHWKKALTSAEEVPSASVVRKKAKPRRSVQVFNPDKVDAAMQRLSELNQDKRAGGDRVLEHALLNDGYRVIPNVKRASAQLENAKANFENLEMPLNRLQLDLTLSGAMAPEDFHVTPILLLGDPGIGKTYIATELADALGVEMEKLTAGGAQAAFQINGSHSTWTNAKYGSLINLLAKGNSSSPVVVIDEVDKIANSTNAPILPALLDLLESRSAKCFRDEFFGMEFDCSRMIFILTANSIESVPLPLLSRVNVFDVPRPAPAQRLRIIKHEIKQWQKKTKHHEIGFDMNACHELAERVDLDLRKTTDLVREGFGRAISAGSTGAKLSIPKNKVRSIGF